jgi:hypothetical protein
MKTRIKNHPMNLPLLKKSISLVCGLFLFLSFTMAQQTTGLAGFLKVGYADLSTAGKTLTKVAPEGYTGFDDGFTIIGAEAYYKDKGFIVGLDASMGFQEPQERLNNEVIVVTPAGYLKGGWVVNEGKHHWIYPTLGIGGNLMLMLTNEGGSDEDDYELYRGIFNPSGELALNADIILANVPDSGLYGAFILGVKVGYRGSFKHDYWFNEDGDEIQNLPSYSNKGFFFTITLGGGGFKR